MRLDWERKEESEIQWNETWWHPRNHRHRHPNRKLCVHLNAVKFFRGIQCARRRECRWPLWKKNREPCVSIDIFFPCYDVHLQIIWLETHQMTYHNNDGIDWFKHSQNHAIYCCLKHHRLMMMLLLSHVCFHFQNIESMDFFGLSKIVLLNFILRTLNSIILKVGTFWMDFFWLKCKIDVGSKLYKLHNLALVHAHTHILHQYLNDQTFTIYECADIFLLVHPLKSLKPKLV